MIVDAKGAFKVLSTYPGVMLNYMFCLSQAANFISPARMGVEGR